MAYFGGRHPDFRVTSHHVEPCHRRLSSVSGHRLPTAPILTAVPTDVFDHTAASDVAVERVWSHLQDPDKWKAMGGIDRISDPRFDPRGLLEGFEFVSTIGGRDYPGTAVTIAADPNTEMVVDVETTEIGARLTVSLSVSDHGGTTLDVSMRVTSKSFLASMMWGLVSATVGAGLPKRVHEMVSTFD